MIYELSNKQQYIYVYSRYILSIKFLLPSGYLTVRHGKTPFLIGKPSTNGPFAMAMINNQMVLYILIRCFVIFGIAPPRPDPDPDSLRHMLQPLGIVAGKIWVKISNI